MKYYIMQTEQLQCIATNCCTISTAILVESVSVQKKKNGAVRVFTKYVIFIVRP